MFRFITFVACITIAAAGIIPEHHGLHTYSLPSIHDTIIEHPSAHLHSHHHHSGIALSAPTIVKYAPAPIIKYAEPIAPIVKISEPVILKSYAPLAESYSNVHKLSYKIPVAHHHSAIALPSYHHTSPIALPYSAGHLYGHSSYGPSYEHSTYGHSAYGHSAYEPSLYGHSYGHHGLLH